MKTKINLCLTRWMLLSALAALALLSPLAATGQERGQTVRLRIGAATTGQEVELYGASYALVIGVSDYTNGWGDLPGVREDVPAVKAALERHGFKVTTALNPTRRQFDDAVGQFIGAYGQRRGNRLLIYFAGHGHTLKTQDGRRELGYIVPANAPKPKANDTGEFKRFAVSMNEVSNYAEQIEAIHALFVFDSCFAGTIFKSRSGGVPEAITDKIVQPVRQFITAGNEKQTVPDYSYFRRAFVAALDGAADDSRDGFITGTELGEYLHREVSNYTKRAQTPQHGKMNNPDLNEGDLVFVAPKRETIALIEPCATEEEAWQRVRNSRNSATVRAFLREYPNCRYAANARILLAELETPSTGRYARVNGNKPLVTMSFTTAKVDANGRVTRLPGQTANGYIEQLPGGVKLEMVEVTGGTFMMGSPDNEEGRYKDEGPQHRVTVRDFYCGRHEVTQGQWKAVMGSLPPDMSDLGNQFRGDDLPVVRVSWDEAKGFIEKLNELTGGDYRLPSEAEWEYAARAGGQEAFSFGPTITPEVVNYYGAYPYGQAAKGKYEGSPVRVGSYPANAFGLFDMHGNVWEWCEDDWHDSYNGGPVDGRAWVDISNRALSRVHRDGSWNLMAASCRSASRGRHPPGSRDFSLGFRLFSTASGK